VEAKNEVKPIEIGMSSVAEKIEMRKAQSSTDRLVEYMTGLRLDDPELIDRLEIDQMKIRTKYGLPEREYRFANPGEYEKYLKEIAEVNGVKVRLKNDCGSFFGKYAMAGGVYLNTEKTIGVDINKETKDDYTKSLATLEHELIHALQHKHYPGMPVEVQEYEAYVAGWNIDYLRDKPESKEIVFGFGVMGSIKHWYTGIKKQVRR